MNKKFFDAHSMSISEYIDLLFTETKNNILHIPRFDENDLSDDPDYTEDFIMNWDRSKADKAIGIINLLVSSIKRCAEIKKTNENNFLIEIEKDDNAHFVWEKYIKTLDTEPVDYDKINDIIERKDGGDLTNEEWEYYDRIMSDRAANAQFRVGGKVYAYKYAVTCQRLFKLYLLNAPAIVIHNEIISLAEAVAINNYAVSSYQDEIDAIYEATYNDFKKGTPDKLKKLDEKYNSAMKSTAEKYGIEGK